MDFSFLIFEITLLSEAFLASLEKDAKERAKRRRENKVLADGNCQSFHFLMAGMICAGESRGVYAAVWGHQDFQSVGSECP